MWIKPQQHGEKLANVQRPRNKLHGLRQVNERMLLLDTCGRQRAVTGQQCDNQASYTAVGPVHH
jgi:hypothetical protein